MQRAYVIIGIPLGVVLFYVLSLSSAFWTAIRFPTDYAWAIVLCVVGYGAPWLVALRRPAIAVCASVTMIVLIVWGVIGGSDVYFGIAPIPQDFLSLFFHGGRSPLVLGLATSMGVVGLLGVLAHRTGSSHSSATNAQRDPEPPHDGQEHREGATRSATVAVAALGQSHDAVGSSGQ